MENINENENVDFDVSEEEHTVALKEKVVFKKGTRVRVVKYPLEGIGNMGIVTGKEGTIRAKEDGSDYVMVILDDTVNGHKDFLMLEEELELASTKRVEPVEEITDIDTAINMLNGIEDGAVNYEFIKLFVRKESMDDSEEVGR